MSLSEVLLRAGACLIWGALGLYLMLPRGQAGSSALSRWIGAALILLSFSLLLIVPSSVTELTPALLGLSGKTSFDVTYWILAVSSLASAVMMLTSRNPVYSALWFAMVLLSNAGLYALHDAQFLAAATVIVYAGAVVVTSRAAVVRPSTTASPAGNPPTPPTSPARLSPSARVRPRPFSAASTWAVSPPVPVVRVSPGLQRVRAPSMSVRSTTPAIPVPWPPTPG